MTEPLAGMRIGVVGLARSGLAAARLALARGAEVYASDAGDTPALRAAADAVRSLGGRADVGGHDHALLGSCDRIVLSPGIPPTLAVLRDPAVRGVPVIGEMEFAFRQLEAPVVAVTGTNGKTTVTSLAAHLLERAGLDVAAGGNIGTALSEVALREPPPAVVVVEASSFQLGGADRFAPAVGVLTNLAPDHLDWYPGIEEYYADKARLFRNATPESRWVINGEDRRARELPGAAAGERYHFRVESQPPAGERGGYLSADGWLTLRMGEGPEERVLPASELQILGLHNLANALAAALAARLVGAEVPAIAEGLRSFGALPHRMEPVTERGGVLWINDSKATNVASACMALRSLTRPAVLLLGGRHKGEPYLELLPELQARVRTVLAFGEAAELIERELGGRVPLERVSGSFEEVVGRARALARPGDAVLLAPACSSYDMFRDYEERGDRFRELAMREEG
jgi:UDP-N-acetylmuramoylalanine--D-glutamate ligase